MADPFDLDRCSEGLSPFPPRRFPFDVPLIKFPLDAPLDRAPGGPVRFPFDAPLESCALELLEVNGGFPPDPIVLDFFLELRFDADRCGPPEEYVPRDADLFGWDDALPPVRGYFSSFLGAS